MLSECLWYSFGMISEFHRFFLGMIFSVKSYSKKDNFLSAFEMFLPRISSEFVRLPFFAAIKRKSALLRCLAEEKR